MSDARIRVLEAQLAAVEAKLTKQARMTADTLGLCAMLIRLMAMESPAARIQIGEVLAEMQRSVDPITAQMARTMAEGLKPKG